MGGTVQQGRLYTKVLTASAERTFTFTRPIKLLTFQSSSMQQDGHLIWIVGVGYTKYTTGLTHSNVSSGYFTIDTGNSASALMNQNSIVTTFTLTNNNKTVDWTCESYTGGSSYYTAYVYY